MKLPTRLLAGAAALLFTTGITAAATVVADADLNVRSGPGTQYPVIAVIPDGVAVNATGCQGGWCRVDYRGHLGWASSAYLTGAAAAPYSSSEPYSYSYNEPYYGEPYDDGLYGFGFGPTFGYGYAVNRFHVHHFAHVHHFGGPHFAGSHFGGAHFAGGSLFGGGHFGGAHFGGAHFAGGSHFGGGHFGGAHFGGAHFAGGSHFGGGHFGGPHFAGGSQRRCALRRRTLRRRAFRRRPAPWRRTLRQTVTIRPAGGYARRLRCPSSVRGAIPRRTFAGDSHSAALLLAFAPFRASTGFKNEPV